MAHTVGTFVIWAVVLSVGIPLALMILYQIYKARMFLLGGALLIALFATIYFDPLGFLVLCALIATPFVIGRLRYKHWTLDEQVNAKLKADRISKGYDSNP